MPARELGTSFDAPHIGQGVGSSLLKRHKILPHPREERAKAFYPSTPTANPRDLVIDTGIPSTSNSDTSSPHTLKHASRRIIAPSLPPTPPSHSRQSSGNHASVTSAPRYDVASIKTASENLSAPSTPANQRSPPTPDVTPPRTMPPLAFRPRASERYPSSRTDSFRTAREHLDSSDEDEASTLRPNLASARPSESEIPQFNGRAQRSTRVGLGLGLESDNEGTTTPRQSRDSEQEFVVFDGEWGACGDDTSEVEREWDDNLMRNVTVRKRPQRPRLFTDIAADEVLEDDIVSPTNATRLVRGLSLQERIARHRVQRASVDRSSTEKFAEQIEWPPSVADPESPSSIPDVRRFSTMSGRSTTSTVVEAMVLDSAPARRKTLRHTKKQIGLREFSSDQSTTSGPTSVASGEPYHHHHHHHHHYLHRTRGRIPEKRHESLVSNSASATTTTSGRSRREVLSNGGIPVVVIPDRRSSTKSSKAPSLRSTSSRKSKRSNSMNSAPLSQSSKFNERGYFDVFPPRKRTMSESAGSNQSVQTIDFPPRIPARNSSLSAPTSRNESRTTSLPPHSRNTSRAGSLTAESLKSHNLLQARISVNEPQTSQRHARVEIMNEMSNSTTHRNGERTGFPFEHRSPPCGDSSQHKDIVNRNTPLNVDHNGDPFFGNRLSTQVTPFSQASYETAGTTAEVSEAMAVSIYPHKNKSVLVVQHQPPSEPSPPSINLLQTSQPKQSSHKMTFHEKGPATPPQLVNPMDEVDSPLRNPRAPPQPPTIKFIPPTPAGLTPGQEEERQLGYDPEEQRPSTSDSKRAGSLSLMRRAFSKRRNSEPLANGSSLFKRTFSLSNRRRELTDESTQTSKADANLSTLYPSVADRPADGSKLHPFWRPAHFWDDLEDSEAYGDDEYGGHFPPVDNRPPHPKRSLSGKLKRTFAILPIKDDYEHQRAYNTERRTMRRTDSGNNLRVVKQRSDWSLRREGNKQRRLYTETPRPHSDGGPADLPFGHDFKEGNGGRRGYNLPGLGLRVEYVGWGGMRRKLSEKRREQRSEKLRATISGPRAVRSGVDDVLRSSQA